MKKIINYLIFIFISIGFPTIMISYLFANKVDGYKIETIEEEYKENNSK